MCKNNFNYVNIILEKRDKMNQEKIGKFISEERKKLNITQEQLADHLGVSKNAVSKWERGICLMDMSLLKPLSQILNVNVIDILSGEKVSLNELPHKCEETLENIVKINTIKSKSFGVYGMLIIYVILTIYKIYNNIYVYDIVSILCSFNTFKFAYKYKLEKNKGDLIISIISFLVCVFTFAEYVLATIK